MEILKYILIAIVIIVGGYTIFRVLSMAIFKSWFDAKKQNRERDNEDEINKVNEWDDGEIGRS